MVGGELGKITRTQRSREGKETSLTGSSSTLLVGVDSCLSDADVCRTNIKMFNITTGVVFLCVASPASDQHAGVKLDVEQILIRSQIMIHNPP